jgi:hypothetical protein
MNPQDVIRLLQHILPWIPSSNESIRGEIEEVIRQLKGK